MQMTGFEAYRCANPFARNRMSDRQVTTGCDLYCGGKSGGSDKWNEKEGHRDVRLFDCLLLHHSSLGWKRGGDRVYMS
jgi:hypothetical protein